MITALRLFLVLCLVSVVYAGTVESEERKRRIHIQKVRHIYLKRCAKQNVSFYRRGYLKKTAFGASLGTIPEPYFRRMVPLGFKIEFYGIRFCTYSLIFATITRRACTRLLCNVIHEIYFSFYFVM